MKSIEDATQNMTTLSECVINAIESGYVENFRIDGTGLISEDGKSIYQQQNVAIVNFYRFEGNSNPADNAILYLIETSDGRKGTLIDAYGVYADSEFSNFIRTVTHISKGIETSIK